MQRAGIWVALASVVVMVVTWVGTASLVPPGYETRGKTAPAAAQGRRPAAASSIRIEGNVDGVAVGEGGTLTVRMDGVAVQQVAASAGAFAVDVAGERPSGMVSLEYQQPGVHFTTLLGSYVRLARLAGTDARLTREECECTRVSAFSTALEHVADMVLGHPPRSDVEFTDAIRRMGFDLDTATVVLVRLAAEPSLVPASHESGLALLRDRPAFLSYLYKQNYSLTLDPAAALDNLPVSSMTDADVPDRAAILGAVLDLRSPLSTSASVLERDGTGFVLHVGYAEHPRAYVGGIQGDALVLAPQGERPSGNHGSYWCPSSFGFTDARWELTRREMRRQWANERLEIWRMSHELEITHPDCPELPNSVERSSSFSTIVDLAKTRALTNSRKFYGSTALPLFCSTADEFNGSQLLQCAYAVHEFAHNGSGEVVDLGDKVGDRMEPVQAAGRLPFSWTMGPDGAMHVQVGEERTRYWILDGGDRGALGVVYVADADRQRGNVSFAGYTAMIRADAPDAYTSESALGAWRYGTMDFANRPHVDLDLPRQVRIVRDASGRSVQWSDSYPGSVERWTTAWGRLYSTRYTSSTCVEPTSSCHPSTVRYFRPLARVGDRIHGIEEIYTSGGGQAPDYGASLGTARPQFHERQEMPVSDAHVKRPGGWQ